MIKQKKIHRKKKKSQILSQNEREFYSFAFVSSSLFGTTVTKDSVILNPLCT